MRIPLTPLGTRELVLFGVLPLAAGAFLAFRYGVLAGLPLFAIAAFVFAFFRDPERRPPADPRALVSAADGVVNCVLEVDEPEYIEGRGLRVGVFLSVFDVHVNRSPCAGTVEYVRYRKGKFLDARSPRCPTENEANAIGIRMDDGTRVLVRQVAGLIARRILCTVQPGQRVERGARIGMIKFGSYTEVVVQAASGFEPAVALAARVQGAATPLFTRGA